MGLVLWFSSYSPEFRRLTSDEFQVGLLTTEGLGETLQANLPVMTAAEKIEPEEALQISQQDTPSDVREMAEDLISSETLPAIEQTVTEPAELTEVITPETSPAQDVAPPAIIQTEEKIIEPIEQSQPVEIALLNASTSSATENIEITEAPTPGNVVDDVAPVNDFFKPAEIETPGDPLMTLPIEQLSEVTEPEITLADIDPELANADVEILEIRAREVLIASLPDQSKSEVTPPPARQQLTPSVQTGSGDDELHPRQQSLTTQRDTEASRVSHTNNEQLQPVRDQSTVIPKTYIIELRNLLNQFKQYPRKAYLLHQEGVVIVSLVIDRRGNIISHSIKRRSGYSMLDEEVELMVQRAKKMPALPADYPRDSLELLVPIRFKVSKR